MSLPQPSGPEPSNALAGAGDNGTRPFSFSQSTRIALRFALSYAVVSALWIWLSGEVVLWLFPPGPLRFAAETYKGLLYVTVTAVVFGISLARYLRVWEKEITARRAVEAALRASEERLRTVTDFARVGLVIIGRGRRFIYANPTCAEFLNLKVDDLLGKVAAEVIPPLYVEQIRPHLDRTMQGERVHFELHVPDARDPKKMRHYSVVNEPSADATGRLVVIVIIDITEQKLAEQAIRYQAEILEETGRLAHVGGFSFNALTGEGNWTDELPRIHDLEPGTRINRDAGIKYYVGESRQQIAAAVREVVAHGTPYNLELEIESAKGVRKWIRTIAHPIWQDGRVVRVNGSMQDITDLKKLEETRLRQQRRLALVAQISSQLIVADNPALLLGEIFTRLARELDIDIFSNYMLSADHQFLNLQSSGGLTLEQETAFRQIAIGQSLCGLVAQRQDKVVVPNLPASTLPQAEGVIALGVKAYAGFPLLAGGQLIGTISFGSRKIDLYAPEDLRLMETVAAQVAAAVERSRLVEALRSGEERFRSVVENIQEVFWMSDAAKQKIVYVSPGYATVWGRSCESLYASMDSWRESLHPEDRERILDAIVTKQIPGTYLETYRIVRPDGTVRWVQDKAFPVRDPDGIVRRIVGVAEDITDRRELEQRFLRSQRMEAIGALASGIAHDLNNILSPMMLANSLLKGKVQTQEDQAVLAMVERSAKRGADIIQQLLTFSRGLAPQRIPLQPLHLLKEAHQLMLETFPKNITVEFRHPSRLANIVADPTQIHQVLLNLCVNARDAMPQGGTLALVANEVNLSPAEVIHHAPAKPGKHVHFEVRDSGEGIAAGIIERIFDPFFTTKEIGKGTGLGLSTVLGIVKAHEGLVTVESKVGAGTVFHIYLPAAEQYAAGGMAAENSGTKGGHGELILVVDDEEPIRGAITSVLERAGYRVLLAVNGEEAERRWLAQPEAIRLVITDMMMPVRSGLDLIRALRRHSRAVRFVAMSGLDDEDRRHELAELGVTTILSKPFNATSLLGAVSAALSQG